MPHKVFFCVSSGRARVTCSKWSREARCANGEAHRATREIFEGLVEDAERIFHAPKLETDYPEKCDRCDYRFTTSDEYSGSLKREYVRADTGEAVDLTRSPPGACWDAHWDPTKGPDGRSLHVMTPGGVWRIDSRASNCTMPNDDVHRCWVRHGKPEDGSLHVDKSGHTCAAGGGSIMCGSYHGFLHNGHLTDS